MRHITALGLQSLIELKSKWTLHEENMPLFDPIYTNYSIPGSNVYYVSPTGTDAASGGISAPTTLSGAYTKMGTNVGTIVMRGGKYREIEFYVYKPLHIQAYPNEIPVMDGSKLLYSGTGTNPFVVDGSDYRLDNYTIEHPLLEAASADAARPWFRNCQHVFLNDAPLMQVTNRSELAPGKFWVDLAGDKLYLRDNPSGKPVEATSKYNAIQFAAGSQGSSCRGIVALKYLRNFGVNQVRDITFEKCTGNYGSIFGMTVFRSDRASIDSCVFSYNGQTGFFYSGYGHSQSFTNITARYNNFRLGHSDYSASNIKVHECTRPLVAGCTTSHVYGGGPGIWIDVNVKDALVVNNVSHNNGSGIFDEISQHNLYAGNYCYDNSIGIWSKGSRFTHIENNTLINNNTAILTSDSGRRNDPNPQQAADSEGGWIQFNTTIDGNLIIVKNAASCEAYHIDGYNTESGPSYVKRIEQNHVYIPGAGNYAVWEVGGVATNYATLTALKASVSSHCVTDTFYSGATNPFFANPVPNFTLKADSPARGKVRGACAHVLNVPLGKLYDAGAYQTGKITSGADCTVQVNDAVQPLQAQITSLQAEASGLQGTINDLEALVTTRDASLSASQAEVASLTQQLSTTFGSNAELVAQLQVANEAVVAKQALLDTAQSDLATAQAALANATVSLRAGFVADLDLIGAAVPGYTQVNTARSKYL